MENARLIMFNLWMLFLGCLQCCGCITGPWALKGGVPVLKTPPAPAPVVPAKGAIDPKTGKPVALDLPDDRHLRNLPNGGGCCVFASLDMAADWHHFAPMQGVLQDKLGGGWPALVTKTFSRRAPGFNGYVQAEGSKTEEVLDWAFRTGRLPSVTYGYGPRYSGRINHMVCLLHLDPAGTPDARACVLDNNFPKTWEWMSREEFFKRHRASGAWAVCYLLPPPPPSPVN